MYIRHRPQLRRFAGGHAALGYALGGVMTALAILVSVTDICIPSMIHQALVGERRHEVVEAR